MALSASLKESLGEAATTYHKTVAQAADYLKGRGITGEAAVTFRLGYVDEPLIGDEDYQGRLAIPYLTPTGVVDIRYRSIAGSGPKYMGRAGATTHPYNVAALHADSDMLVICEGEIDTITMHGLCGVPAIGMPGAQAWKEHYRILVDEYRKVFVMCDGDQAGREFGKTLIRELSNAVAVHLPDGEDVNSLYLSAGRDAVRGRIGL